MQAHGCIILLVEKQFRQFLLIFFETEEEALEFYDELNRIYCGEGTLPDKEKQPDKPLPAIP